MAIVFNKLLIPVDFSVNTELAIKKALALIVTDKPVVHLLHVVHPRRPMEALAAKNELTALGYQIMERRPDLTVKTHVLKGYSVQRMIMECARMLMPDLIIIARRNERRRMAFLSFRNWFYNRDISPEQIARKADCPVLTVKAASTEDRTRVIVIPIASFLPERKLEWVILLAKRFRAQVHLLALRDHRENGGLPEAFLEAYHFLREHLQHPIEFSAVAGREVARVTLNYAEMVLDIEPLKNQI